jgi:hypothetical protein
MMEDWTDIIGEELENIEEPLPADDWSVLQHKYAAVRRRRKAAALAWIGGFTSVAAAIVLVLVLVGSDSSSVIPDQTSDIPGLTGEHNNLVADQQPPSEKHLPADVVSIETPSETAKKQVPTPVNVVTPSEDELIAQDCTDEPPAEKLLAEADHFDFEDIADKESGRKRRPISIGISGSVSDSPILKVLDGLLAEPSTSPDMSPSHDDTLSVETPQPAMMRSRRTYHDSYRHEVPVSVGLSARFFLTDRLSINTGLNYTRYKSLRTRRFTATSNYQKDWQYVHYLGVPVRLDCNAVNRKHFNLYFGAGAQVDKCVYATVGDERLHEKQFLIGLNAAMGLQVNLVPTVGLYFEPEVSYALNEGSLQTFRSDEPFVITVRGGLRFNF